MDSTRRIEVEQARDKMLAWAKEAMEQLGKASRSGGALPDDKAPGAIVDAYKRALSYFADEGIQTNLFDDIPPDGLLLPPMAFHVVDRINFILQNTASAQQSVNVPSVIKKRQRRTVKFGTNTALPDVPLMARGADEVGRVRCETHLDRAHMDAYTGGVAAISACCKGALDRAETVLRELDK